MMDKGAIFRGLYAMGIILIGITQPLNSQTITPSRFWKNNIVFGTDSFIFGNDPFAPPTASAGDSGWVKFTLLQLEPFDPNIVYFQDSRAYIFHYEFARDCLDPFMGMSMSEYYQIALYNQERQAVLGTVLFPPTLGGFPPQPKFFEYGIQFIGQDVFTKKEIADLFFKVKASISADPDVTAFYFPSYEQAQTAQINQEWFASQGIPVSSLSRWAEGNTCYAEGWALGTLTYVTAEDIHDAYQTGLLSPYHILLTDAVPAEIPSVAGILSLSPSTPSSHVSILAQSQGIPFVHLALVEDVNQAQLLVNRMVHFSAYDDGFGACDLKLMDVEEQLTHEQVLEILELKRPLPLNVSSICSFGAYYADTCDLAPEDIHHFGGKSANFGILRRTIEDHSPRAAAFSFDLWNAFLDQSLSKVPAITIAPGQYVILIANGDTAQGPCHLPFKLSRQGEDIAVFDKDGITLIDGLSFGLQNENVSYGRQIDGSDQWQSFAVPSPGRTNGGISNNKALVINEFMADNRTFWEDPDQAGQYPDWIELYNGSNQVITLNGLYITDDLNEPDKWRIPVVINGSTLREEITDRLSRYTSYPPVDMQALSTDLREIRSLFTQSDITQFGPQQTDGVIRALLDFGFDPLQKIRFRSSTNVEDSENFSGAGLYDSFNGCLADDLDGDNIGPSNCDPCQDDERGVFHAIRKVFASFYNDNAFLERLKYGISETEVGMAVLVHYSFPDEIELANGVATLDNNGPESYIHINLVTQYGAVSVTNPEGGAVPEEVIVRIRPSGYIEAPKLERSSNLVPIGDTVLIWPQDYRELAHLLIAVSEEFAEATQKTTYLLDFEYKKMAPGGIVIPAGGLIIKQVREVPQPDNTPRITPFLINKPQEYCIYPGEFRFLDETDVYADHRLKSQWHLETKSLWLDPVNLQEGFYNKVVVKTVYDNTIGELAFHSFEGSTAYDTWIFDGFDSQMYELQTTGVPTLLPPSRSPMYVLPDLGTQPFMLDEPRFRCLSLRVEYDRPVRSWYQSNERREQERAASGLRATMSNKVHLWSCPLPHENDILHVRYYDSDGIFIRTSFYWPPPPQGAGNWVNHTAPLIRWVETVIEGFTQHPMTLKGYYSQTYRPEHHNLIEHFLFEPRLEPGISLEALDELRTNDIRLIHFIKDNIGDSSRIFTYGFEFTPTDLDNNGQVNMLDFAEFSLYWRQTDCGACSGMDFTGDGHVDSYDLHQFMDTWLQ